MTLGYEKKRARTHTHTYTHTHTHTHAHTHAHTQADVKYMTLGYEEELDHLFRSKGHQGTH